MLNNAILMGRLVADPELRKTASGVSVVNIRIASDRDYVPEGKDREADFVNVTAWNGTADFVSRYFRKGSMIIVKGRIETGSYTDKEGSKRDRVQITAEHIWFGEPRKKGESGCSPESFSREEYPPSEYPKTDDFKLIANDEDMPF